MLVGAVQCENQTRTRDVGGWQVETIAMWPESISARHLVAAQ